MSRKAYKPYHDFLDRLTRKFIVNEGGTTAATIFSYIQSLNESLANMTPRTQTESRRVAMAKVQLKEIKKMARKLQEQVNVLEEKLNVLEERKEGKK